MPFLDLSFCLEPVGSGSPMPTSALLPKFVRALRNLFVEAHVLFRIKNQY